MSPKIFQIYIILKHLGYFGPKKEGFFFFGVYFLIQSLVQSWFESHNELMSCYIRGDKSKRRLLHQVFGLYKNAKDLKYP